jgi:hypothetical protein
MAKNEGHDNFAPMFEKVRDFAKSFAAYEAERKARDNQRAQADDERRRMDEAMKARIAGVRVITGDIRYKYAIVNTVRAWAYVPCPPGMGADPHQATDIAIYNIQREALRLGADAVIHAQFHILRYEQPTSDGGFMAAYETHAFGTAVKILGAPEDWKTENSGAETAA